MSNLHLSLTPLALAVLTLSFSAQAQDAAAGGTLSEVKVSAEAVGSFGASNVQVGAFRDQDPLDVPLTNNVVTREVLDAQGANTLHGALRNTAGVTHAQIGNSTYDNIAIRGILVENRGNYRLNGSLPIINLIDTPLENKERVEVLKGASSMYYGLVPPSGVVNFVTKRAGSTPVSSVATSVNNHGALDVHVDIGRRFGQDDSMGLRVNAVAGKQETGINNYAGERQLVSAAYDWKVNRSLTLKADVEHYRKDASEQAAITVPTIGGVAVVPPLPDNKTNLAGDWQRYNAEATNFLLRGDLALSDDWSLILETGRAETVRDRRYSAFSFTSLATGAGNLNISFTNGMRYVNENQRVEVTGRVQTGSLQHELTAGYTQNERWAYSGTSGTQASVSQNYYNPVVIAPLDPVIATTGNISTINDKGVYVFDRLTLSPQWQVMAGLRATDYANQSSPTSRYAITEVSPNVSLMYKPQADTSIYASYLEGLEETGVVSNVYFNAGEILPPAVNKQYEMGVKTRAWAKVFAQAALFQIERPQTTTVPSGSTPATSRIVGGLTRYRGLELSANGELTPQVALVASALLMDPEIVQVGSTNAGELGKTPENTPKRTLSLFGEYRLQAVAGLAFNAAAYHVGERPVNNLNQAWVPAYTTYSLGTRYRTRWDGSKVTLQANIDNLTDRNYWLAAGGTLLSTGAPRTLRVAAKFDF